MTLKCYKKKSIFILFVFFEKNLITFLKKLEVRKIKKKNNKFQFCFQEKINSLLITFFDQSLKLFE